MTTHHPTDDTDTPTACVVCVVTSLKRHTADEQAWSDVARPWRAWGRGYEKVYGEMLPLPGRKELLSREDIATWDSVMAAHIRANTLAVYRSTINLALRGLVCPHGHWGEGPEEAGAAAKPIVPPRVGGPGNALSLPGTVETEFSVSDIFGAAHPPTFIRPELSSGSGFKLSVAQKSLSLALKHSWLHGAIDEPPVCPVDRRVLNEAARITGQPWFTNWTEVNDIPTYERHLDLLTHAAGTRSLAVWELLAFEGLLERPSSQQLIADATISFFDKFDTRFDDPHWPETMLKDAVRSSLQHNPTYLPTTPGSVRMEVRRAMRRYIVVFLRRWSALPRDEQSVATFKGEVLDFRVAMNDEFKAWLR